MKLTQAIEGFAIHLASAGYSARTIESYRMHLSQLATHLNDPEAGTLTEQALRQFLAWLRTDYRPTAGRAPKDAPLADTSVTKAVTAIKSFCRWLHAEKFVRRRPDKNIPIPQSASKEVAPYTREEIDAMLKHAECLFIKATTRAKAYKRQRRTGKRDVAIIYFLLDTGVRVGEACRMTVGDVNLASGSVHVAQHGAGRKTKDHYTALGKAARRAVWMYLTSRGEVKDADLMFLSDEGRPLTRNAVRQMIDDVGQRAGVPNAHPHRFRHTCAYLLWRNRGDILLVNRVLGHNSLNTTRVYLQRITGEDLRSEHVAASPADNLHL